VSLAVQPIAEVLPLLGSGFDCVIDARSPAEFAEDHLPGAVNWPVLDDEQRREVGTLYKQVSPLEARKLGAVLVARNIAQHLEREMADKPREWRPLVYCWRGGQRSHALAWYLGQIGFRAVQLAGGYKGFREHVRHDLETLPNGFAFHVLCGRTGSGKTRLLGALAEAGAQVLDLEGLACHRGSVLGGLPAQPQPSQKAFDTAVWSALRGFDPARPVYVESESRKIGTLRVPESLLRHMHAEGRCLRVEMDMPARLQLLLEDYGFFADDAEGFCRLIEGLVEMRGRHTVEAWQAMARAGRWSQVFAELMQVHYDPLYDRSVRRSFPHIDQAEAVSLPDGSAEALRTAARALVAAH
jgi:tRNA 2-selenouridine synthase